MTEHVAFADSNIQSWELWIAASALSILAWVVIRLIGKWDGLRKVVRKNTIRIDRIESDVVAEVRGFRQYPPIPDDIDDNC